MIYLTEYIENKKQFTEVLRNCSQTPITLIAMTRDKFLTVTDKAQGVGRFIGHIGKLYGIPVFVDEGMNDTILFAVEPNFNDLITLEPYPNILNFLDLEKAW